ncbi:MAG: nucleotidyltransferase domain-containing protein [Bacteroidia bacterium]|nr:nucleotidyltransferase domain-containing protein [Bacteroidia bacterium]
MVKSKILNIVDKYATAVSHKYSPLKVFLFGSCAKGMDDEHSDIDIAVVFEDFPDYFEMQMNLMRIRRDIDIRIEPHPFKFEDFNHDDPVAHEVLQHGIEINISQPPAIADMVAEVQEHYTTK